MHDAHQPEISAVESAIPARHRAALHRICDRLAVEPVIWALTGSTSFVLQGVPVLVNGIDIQTDETGAYRIAQCFTDQVTRPVTFSSTDRIRSHYGAFLLDGMWSR